MIKKPAIVLAVVPLIIGLTACTAASGDTPEGPEAELVESSGDLNLAFEDLPGCDLVTAHASDLIGNYVPAPDGLESVVEVNQGVSVTCSWVTPETIEGNAFDLDKFGGLGIRVDIEKDASTRAELEEVGLVREYAAADDAGAWVVSFNPKFDPTDEISALGLTVSKGNVSVGFSSSGVFLDANNVEGVPTNAGAIQVALRILTALEG